MIEAEKATEGVPVSRACELLGVSRSGYHKWRTRPPSDRALSDAWLAEKITEIYKANRRVYGAPRVHAELRLQYGIRVGRKRVERLMRQGGLSGLIPKKRGRTTVRVPGVRVADDLVKRQFRPDAPDVLWIADITYLRTWEGWLYLAAVQDAYSRRIVGWSMADHMRSELVVDALTMGVSRRRPAPGLIHHSDQGGQGEFNWSSQRLMKEGCDGQASWLDEGVDGPVGDEVAGGTVVASGRGAVVLACDREGLEQRGGRAGRRGVPGRREPLVPRTWRDANVHARPTLRPLPVF
jgi:putative transposase